MNSITIKLGLPPKELSPNSRCHWRRKAAATKGYRYSAATMALVASGGSRPQWKAAKVQATFYHAQNRRRDRDNALASLKAAFDGLADAQIVGNDSGLTHEPVVFLVDKARPRVVLTVTKQEVANG